MWSGWGSQENKLVGITSLLIPKCKVKKNQGKYIVGQTEVKLIKFP